MRRVGRLSSACRQAGTVAGASLEQATRSMRDAKGITEYRLTTHLWPKEPKDALADYQQQLLANAATSPATRALALAHLTLRPKYEYTPEFQRWANDMMAVQSDPMGWVNDMAYHYHRVWKIMSPSHTWASDGNGSMEIVRLTPNT